jgi:hypothetical protein
MPPPSYRLGLTLLSFGTCLVVAALVVAGSDAARWFIAGTWSDTSLRSVFGPFPGQASADWRQAIEKAWRQPLWLLMVLAGASFAVPGSKLMGAK